MEERDRGIHGIGITCDLKFDMFCDGSGDLGHGGFPGVSREKETQKISHPVYFRSAKQGGVDARMHRRLPSWHVQLGG